MLSKLFYFVAGTLSVVYAAETTGVAYLRNVASDPYNSLTMKVNLTISSSDVRSKLFSQKKNIHSNYNKRIIHSGGFFYGCSHGD